MSAVNAVDAVSANCAELWDSLKEVMDPEFPVSLVDLGLIYDIRRSGGTVEIDLTFTATACPCMDFVDETANRSAWVPKAARIALVSVGSLAGVPVPWALTY